MPRIFPITLSILIAGIVLAQLFATARTTTTTPSLQAQETDITSLATLTRTTFVPLAPLHYPLPPIPNSVRFAVIGDYGDGGTDEKNVAALVAALDPDFIITTGDNNYPVGAAATIDRHVGRYYSRYIYPYKGKYEPGFFPNRFFPSLGNHDWYSDDAIAYLDYFPIDTSYLNTGSSDNERYYDFIQGPVHLFALDSYYREPDGNTGDSIQADWLQAQLASSQTPWQIAYFHHAPYSSGKHGSFLPMQWPFADWGIDAVLAGHDHDYERLLVGEIPYFVNGIGGKSLRDFDPPIPESRFRYNADFGAMLITVTPSYMQFQLYSLTGGGSLMDTYTMLIDGTRCEASARTLLPAGSIWKYFDTDGAPGSGWQTAAYNDASWPEGPAVLGFGDSQATRLTSGHVTYYFRHIFTPAPIESFETLELGVLRDDGAIVYLNGDEVFRTNMPDGKIISTTLASSVTSGAEETTFYTIELAPDQLQSGPNLVAVEVHQVSSSSSDVSFDLFLNARNQTCPGLQATATVVPAVASVGQTVSYTYAITNIGTAPLTAVTLTDDLFGPWSLPHSNLATGGIVSQTLTYTVQTTDLPGPIVNQATIQAQPPAASAIIRHVTTTLAIQD